MQRFAELRRAGDSALVDRLDLLNDHRGMVAQHIADLRGHLQALELKITFYQDLLEAADRNGPDHT